jgi:acetyltransferase-like isoleucine patch superfamily enzyme
MLSHFIKKYRLIPKIKALERAGAGIGRGTLPFPGTENFGSEPYLIRIGENCVIADGVKFITHDGAIRVIKQKEEYSDIDNKYGKIDIRDNVYIGDNAIIMPNVTIGPDACVLPGSIVYKDVPPGSAAAGNPAVSKKLEEGFREYYRNELYPYYENHFYRHFRHLW